MSRSHHVVTESLPSHQDAICTHVEVPLPPSVETTLPTPIDAVLPTSVEITSPTSVETALPTSVEAALPTSVEAALPTAVEAALPTSDETTLPSSIETTLPTIVEAPLPDYSFSATGQPAFLPNLIPTAVPYESTRVSTLATRYRSRSMPPTDAPSSSTFPLPALNESTSSNSAEVNHYPTNMAYIWLITCLYRVSS